MLWVPNKFALIVLLTCFFLRGLFCQREILVLSLTSSRC